MAARWIDNKASDTLVVFSERTLWTRSSTLLHLHQIPHYSRGLTPESGRATSLFDVRSYGGGGSAMVTFRVFDEVSPPAPVTVSVAV